MNESKHVDAGGDMIDLLNSPIKKRRRVTRKTNMAAMEKSNMAECDDLAFAESLVADKTVHPSSWKNLNSEKKNKRSRCYRF